MTEKKVLFDWNFTIEKLNHKSKITVPHTWNVCDETQHYRGRANYQTDVLVDKSRQTQRVILSFGAVYHSADVFVNGTFVGSHRGSGYTPFSFDITDAVFFGSKNRIEVFADNKPSKNMLPYMKHFDWADDGGLIREVSLLFAEPKAIETVFVSPQLTDIENGLCSGYLDLNFKFYDLHKMIQQSLLSMNIKQIRLC